MTKWDLSQKYKVDLTYENQSMQYTILTEKENHTTISINAGKALYKIQHLFIIKTLMKLRIIGNILNLINGNYKNPQLTSHLMVKD